MVPGSSDEAKYRSASHRACAQAAAPKGGRLMDRACLKSDHQIRPVRSCFLHTPTRKRRKQAASAPALKPQANAPADFCEPSRTGKGTRPTRRMLASVVLKNIC